MRKQRQERDRQRDQRGGVGGEFGDLERDVDRCPDADRHSRPPP
jgi:hypothetical protein